MRRVRAACPENRLEVTLRVLVTGHNGYIGCVLVPLLLEAGHDVGGLDNYLYETCTFGDDVEGISALRKDVRDVEAADLEGFEAVIHLAAISNDPVGDLNADTTYDINHRAASNLARYAFTTGEALIKSDGMPWRPLVHIEDISRAFVALLHAPREVVHDEAFNVGQTSENYRVRDVAAIVEEVVPGSKATYSNEAAPDIRNYRVSCDKLESLVPEYQPQWTVRRGVEQLYDAFLRNGLELEDFLSRRFLRIKHVKELQEEGVLDEGLRRLDLEPTFV